MRGARPSVCPALSAGTVRCQRSERDARGRPSGIGRGPARARAACGPLASYVVLPIPAPFEGVTKQKLHTSKMKNALLTSLTAVGLALSLPAQAHSITSVGSGCDGTSPSTPLTLTSTAPVIGTTWSLTETNIPAGAFGMFFFGDTVIDPGIDLTSIGGTGCFIYTNANIGFQIANLTGGTTPKSFRDVPAELKAGVDHVSAHRQDEPPGAGVPSMMVAFDEHGRFQFLRK